MHLASVDLLSCAGMQDKVRCSVKRKLVPKGRSFVPYTVQKPQQLVYTSMLFLFPQKATAHYVSCYQM